MITENAKWEEAKKQAKDFLNNHSWSSNIRFMMALRDAIQKRLDAHIKEVEKK
jgi:hypothetical protein